MSPLGNVGRITDVQINEIKQTKPTLGSLLSVSKASESRSRSVVSVGGRDALICSHSCLDGAGSSQCFLGR